MRGNGKRNQLDRRGCVWQAVTVLLALLSLGIKNLKLGPRVPAFVTLSVSKMLVEQQFKIAPITTPDEDLRAILQDWPTGVGTCGGEI